MEGGHQRGPCKTLRASVGRTTGGIRDSDNRVPVHLATIADGRDQFTMRCSEAGYSTQQELDEHAAHLGDRVAPDDLVAVCAQRREAEQSRAR